MRRTRLLGLVSIARATLAGLLLAPVLVSAQEVTGPALKAAYLFHFATFTHWPTEAMPGAEPFVMCVSGDAVVADELERAIKGRALGSHKMIVLREAAPDAQRVCHLLYLSGMARDRAAQLLAGVRDLPVLTISDVDGFIDAGGIAQFFFEQGRLRFMVRVESARRARLLISSRLLAVATRK